MSTPGRPPWRVWWRWLPPLAWAGGIFLASSFTSDELAKTGIELWDKAVHFGIYFVLGALLLVPTLRPLLALLLASLFGASDEFHQQFTEGRVMSAGDLGADVLGAAAGVLVGWLLYLRPRRLARRGPSSSQSAHGDPQDLR